ncbi:MAG: transposase [Candidatus Hodarchaeales archaeon]
MTKLKLPRFPPRKARKTPTLIRFVVKWFDKFQLLSNPIPANSAFNMKSRLKLLLLAAIDRTSISRKARDLREQELSIPSGETTLAWLKNSSVEEVTISQRVGFLKFLDGLPKSFQRVRKKGMVLAIDFHLDPNYAKTSSVYIRGGKKKASTHQFYQYLTVIWVNAPELITLGVQLIPKKYSTLKTLQDLLGPLITHERITGLLADGDFYNYDLIEWLLQNKIFFIVRGRVNHGVKPLVQKYQEELNQKRKFVIVDYQLNKGHTRKHILVKLVLYREGRRIFSLVVPPNCQFSGLKIRKLYRRRFMIETYYRQMHRFQMFSCSQHPAVRYIIVLLAFWLCNFWAYFKTPLNFLKNTSRRCRADFVYTANDFCEFLLTSWYRARFEGQEVLSRM